MKHDRTDMIVKESLEMRPFMRYENDYEVYV
jgi:hypothetical protein